MVTSAELFVEADDVKVGEVDAACTLWLAQAIFVVGAMDIDVTIVRIDVAAEVYARLQAAQPEDAAGDEIGLLLGVGEFRKMAASRNAPLKNHPGGLPSADAFGDFV